MAIRLRSPEKKGVHQWPWRRLPSLDLIPALKRPLRQSHLQHGAIYVSDTKRKPLMGV